jgi:hypothetical protein
VKRTIVVASLTALLTLTVAIAAAAQTGALSTLLGGLVVTIDQAVPVELTLASTLDDGTVVTSTVPLTVGVNLAITISGAQVVEIAAGESEAAVTVAGLGAAPASESADAPAGALVDNNSFPYTIETPEDFAVGQVRSDLDYEDDLALLGELTNTGRSDAEYVKVTVTAYGPDGELLGSEYTYTDLDTIAPGQTSVFELTTDVPLVDVGSYRIQVQE